ncbi:MAG: hypothetical protein EOM12_13800 [Verrucomicrobiae bacterium]|nr:hypothetical protein [Verrucomicrobiae bacterium]
MPKKQPISAKKAENGRQAEACTTNGRGVSFADRNRTLFSPIKPEVAPPGLGDVERAIRIGDDVILT